MRQFKCPLAWFKWRAMVLRGENLLLKTVLVTGVSNAELYVVCYFLWCLLYLVVVTHTVYHSYDTDQGWSYSDWCGTIMVCLLGLNHSYDPDMCIMFHVGKTSWKLSDDYHHLVDPGKFSEYINLGFRTTGHVLWIYIIVGTSNMT